MNAHSIFTARTGVIKDEGGPSKYLKSESSNTVWDNDKSNKLSQQIDSKERVSQQKQEIADNRRHAEQARMDDIIDALRTTDQTKGASVSPAGSGYYSGTNYKTNNNNMSIFDSKDFERLPEKTSGEKVAEENAQRKKEVDNSWRTGGKSTTTKEVVSDFFSNLFEKKE
jgi:hypothetical protein